MPEQPVILVKAYDLTLWMARKAERFRRPHRSVGDRIVNESFNLLEDLVSASYGRNRVASLDRAQHRINLLRFQLRMAKDLGLLNADSYGFASESLDEVGRMAGGWRKAASTQPA